MKSMITKKGFSGFSLKYLAAALMLLDHIHYMFSYTGRIPVFFSWLGRLAAPVFVFCIVEGFVHTHDRKRYFLRIYLLSILMGLIHFSFYNIGAGLVRADGFFPQNQMLSSLTLLIVVLQGICWCEEKHWMKGLAAILLTVGLPFVFAWLFQLFVGVSEVGFGLNLLSFTVLPLHTAIADGGTMTLLTGAALYLFRKNRIRQAVAFVLLVSVHDVLLPMLMMGDLSLGMLLWEAYEWMEIFAVIPMLCYNGMRGTGSKAFFYWFYPIHIYLLYALSCILF